MLFGSLDVIVDNFKELNLIQNVPFFVFLLKFVLFFQLFSKMSDSETGVTVISKTVARTLKKESMQAQLQETAEAFLQKEKKREREKKRGPNKKKKLKLDSVNKSNLNEKKKNKKKSLPTGEKNLVNSVQDWIKIIDDTVGGVSSNEYKHLAKTCAVRSHSH